jgi:hypothetical protein
MSQNLPVDKLPLRLVEPNVHTSIFVIIMIRNMLHTEQENQLKRLAALLAQFEDLTTSDFDGTVSLAEDTAHLGEDGRRELERLSELRRAALSKVAGSALQKIDHTGEINLSFE